MSTPTAPASAPASDPAPDSAAPRAAPSARAPGPPGSAPDPAASSPGPAAPALAPPGPAPAPAAAPGSPWFFPAVDGLRGLAIASVLLYHTNWSPRGLFGVDVFFVVSGFLITLLLLRELGRSNTIRFRRFYVRRVKRLLPGLIIVLGLVVWATWRFGTLQELEANATKALYSLAQIANWQQLASGEAYWEITGAIQPLAHMWSLSITEQFYVVWPIVLLVMWWAARRSPLAVTVLMFVALLGSALVAPLMWDGGNSDRLYLGTETRAVGFVAGAAFASLVYMLVRRRLDAAELPGAPAGRAPLPGPAHAAPAGEFTARRRVLMTAASILSLAIVLAASVATASYHEPWLYLGGIALVSVAAAAFTATLCTRANALVPFFSFSIFVSFGRVSYTVYLLHLPVFWAMQKLVPGVAPMTLMFFGGGLTWLLAAFLHHGITERMRLSVWRARSGIPVLVAGIAAVALMSVMLPQQRIAEIASTSVTAAQVGDIDIQPGRAGGRPVVLTVGDSLAIDFASMLSEAGTGAFAVVNAGIGGCGLMTPEAVRAGGGYVWEAQAHCRAWTDTVPRHLNASEPDIILVHSTWDAADQLVDGRWMDACDADYRGRYAERLESIGSMRDEFAPGAPILFSNDRATNGIISDPQKMACYETLIDEVAQGIEGAQILDWSSALCTPGRGCRSQTDTGEQIFLMDDVHLSPAGMRSLAPWLERALAEVNRAGVPGAPSEPVEGEREGDGGDAGAAGVSAALAERVFPRNGRPIM